MQHEEAREQQCRLPSMKSAPISNIPSISLTISSQYIKLTSHNHSCALLPTAALHLRVARAGRPNTPRSPTEWASWSRIHSSPLCHSPNRLRQTQKSHRCQKPVQRHFLLRPRRWRSVAVRGRGIEGVSGQGPLVRWIACLLAEVVRGFCLFRGIGLDMVRSPWRVGGCECCY